MRHFYVPFFIPCLGNLYVVRILTLTDFTLYTYQLRPSTFQVLSHAWLVAALLASAVLEASNFYNLISLIYGLRIEVIKVVGIGSRGRTTEF